MDQYKFYQCGAMVSSSRDVNHKVGCSVPSDQEYEDKDDEFDNDEDEDNGWEE